MSKFTRRATLRRSAAAVAALLAVSALAACGSDDNGSLKSLNYQLSWVGDYSDVGEIVALDKGFYKDAGIDLTLAPGGTNADPVTMASSGKAMVAKVGSSPSVMLARSEGRPIKAIGSSLQRHPYTYYSLAENPVRTPKDFVGKTVGVQASSGETLLKAVLKKNGVDPKTVKIEIMSDNMEFLRAGKVDVLAGWATNLQALKPLEGVESTSLSLWDAGVQMYANLYVASDSTLKKDGKTVEAFLAASAKGWEYAQKNPEEALAMVLKKFPSLDEDSQRDSLTGYLELMFADYDAEKWGDMDEARWQEQIDMWEDLGEFKSAPPTAQDVMTPSVLDATTAKRPALGR